MFAHGIKLKNERTAVPIAAMSAFVICIGCASEKMGPIYGPWNIGNGPL